MRALLLTLHILGACVWTGGHLVLAITVLPRALARRDAHIVIVTALAVALVVVGTSFQTGGLF